MRTDETHTAAIRHLRGVQMREHKLGRKRGVTARLPPLYPLGRMRYRSGRLDPELRARAEKYVHNRTNTRLDESLASSESSSILDLLLSNGETETKLREVVRVSLRASS